jgi:hypothetical protein
MITSESGDVSGFGIYLLKKEASDYQIPGTGYQYQGLDATTSHLPVS